MTALTKRAREHIVAEIVAYVLNRPDDTETGFVIRTTLADALERGDYRSKPPHPPTRSDANKHLT